jgi:hypothetical protein
MKSESAPLELSCFVAGKIAGCGAPYINVSIGRINFQHKTCISILASKKA